MRGGLKIPRDHSNQSHWTAALTISLMSYGLPSLTSLAKVNRHIVIFGLSAAINCPDKAGHAFQRKKRYISKPEIERIYTNAVVFCRCIFSLISAVVFSA